MIVALVSPAFAIEHFEETKIGVKVDEGHRDIEGA